VSIPLNLDRVTVDLAEEVTTRATVVMIVEDILVNGGEVVEEED